MTRNFNTNLIIYFVNSQSSQISQLCLKFIEVYLVCTYLNIEWNNKNSEISLLSFFYFAMISRRTVQN